MNTEADFWRNVVRSRGGCWQWIGGVSVGRGMTYGRMLLNGARKKAHVIAYELTTGPVPAGKELDHLCKNTLCVNPAHLEAVTHAENVRRGCGADHWRNKTSCPHGHPYDAVNTYVDHAGARRCATCIKDRRDSDRRRHASTGKK